MFEPNHHFSHHAENEFRNIKLKLKGPNRHSELQAVKALMAMSAQHNRQLALGGFAPGAASPGPPAATCAIEAANEQLKPPITATIATEASAPTTTTTTLAPKTTAILNASATPNTAASKQKPASSKKTTTNLKGCDGKNRRPSSAKLSVSHQGRDHGRPMDLSSRSSGSPEPVYGLSITMTEEEFRELAEREGIKDVIGEPICRLCNKLFSGPIGIALHMCPAMRRQTYRCDICGEDKWKTKANLHSHIKWCKKRLSIKSTSPSQQHEQARVTSPSSPSTQSSN